MFRSRFLVFTTLFVSAMLIASRATLGGTNNPAIQTIVPTQTPVTGPSSYYTEKVNLDEFAPPGPGRDLTIMNCGNCHVFVCAIRGQRTLAYWAMVEKNHLYQGRVLLPDEDWNVLFTYLKINFNDQKPEPQLPDALKNWGCYYSGYD